MTDFDYRDGVMHAEDVPLPAIAAAVGTPVYVYAAATLLDLCRPELPRPLLPLPEPAHRRIAEALLELGLT